MYKKVFLANCLQMVFPETLQEIKIPPNMCSGQRNFKIKHWSLILFWSIYLRKNFLLKMIPVHRGMAFGASFICLKVFWRDAKQHTAISEVFTAIWGMSWGTEVEGATKWRGVCVISHRCAATVRTSHTATFVKVSNAWTFVGVEFAWRVDGLNE